MTDSPADFRPTRWSLVALTRAGEYREKADAADEAASRQALEILCRLYWTPLFVFARRDGWQAEDAEDLVQSFFAKSLQKDFFAAADPDKGRLRTFLLTAFRRHLIDERRHRSAEKRGGLALSISIDAQVGHRSGGWQIATLETPEDAYQHRWACALLESCFERLREEYLEQDKAAQFDALSPLLTPGTGRSIAETAAQLGSREGSVRVALHRMRKQFGKIFEEEIRATLLPGEDLADEMRCLVQILSNKSSGA